MGTQRPVVIGETPEELGSLKAEHHGGKKLKDKSEKQDPSLRAEASNQENEVVEKTDDKEKPIKKKAGKAKVRSKKYQEVYLLIDQSKIYDIESAIDLVKKTTLTKFNGNVEVHIRILSKTGKAETLRGFVNYPNSTGRILEIQILDEKIIADILKTGKAPADLYIASPKQMPEVGKLAKILGPKGKMPNPKSGTISENPEKAKAELSGGQVEFKTDSFGNIHQVIGKVSEDAKKLVENFETLILALPNDKISSITLCATMGPGIKVDKKS